MRRAGKLIFQIAYFGVHMIKLEVFGGYISHGLASTETIEILKGNHCIERKGGKHD